MKGNHILKIVAHANQPMQPVRGFRQYEFFVNGQSFYSFPKLFRVGMAPDDPRALSPRGVPLPFVEGGRNSSGRTGSSTGIASLETPNNHVEVCLPEHKCLTLLEC